MRQNITDLSPHFSWGEIYPCDRFSPHLKGTISAVNLKFLHMAEFFSTGTACGACDKYEVCLWPGGCLPACLRFCICQSKANQKNYKYWDGNAVYSVVWIEIEISQNFKTSQLQRQHSAWHARKRRIGFCPPRFFVRYQTFNLCRLQIMRYQDFG